MIRQTIDGIRWELQPDFAPLLAEVLKSHGEVVKESPVKNVSRHRIDGKVFYVKRYLHHRVALRPLKFWFKPSQAAGEWKLAQQLDERKIPVVRHVALGERWSGAGLQESILITEAFPGRQLDETPGVSPRAVQEFVECMHKAGVLQRDLHPANILVRKDPFELRLVDLHGTVVKPVLSETERQENLAILRGYVPIEVSPEIEELGRRIRREQLAERARRCFRHNRDFGPAVAGALRWQVRLPMSDAARHILEGPDRFLAERAQILKRGNSATVGAGDGFVLKRYNLRRAARLVKDLFRPSPAAASYGKAYHLELTGIPTARAFAFAERRRFRFLRASYFLMEQVPGAVSLQDRIRNGEISNDDWKQVAQLIGKMHRQGFRHRDLKASNILFDGNGAPHLIDLDGLTYVGELSEELAKEDLNRLNRGAERWGAKGPVFDDSFQRDYRMGRDVVVP